MTHTHCHMALLGLGISSRMDLHHTKHGQYMEPQEDIPLASISP